MADRHEDVRKRTDRPALDPTLPTVEEVLALDELSASAPEILVGGAALQRRVRWVHVSDSPDVARLLDGDELLLTTGSSWPDDPVALRRLLATLSDSHAAGIVLELGTHYRWVPAAVIEEARARGIALIALHRETRFVAITEAVHSRIISEQTAALRARDEVRERFTTLALRGSPADFVVQQLAWTLDTPVVLENLAHEVISADVPSAREEEVFSDWEARSRSAHRRSEQRARDGGSVDVDDWLIVPVEARGIRWGHIIAFPCAEHPAGRRSVLEQGAIALALGRLSDADGEDWGKIGRARLLDWLLAGRFTGSGGAVARLTAAGVPLAGRRLVGMVAARALVTTESADAAARSFGGRAMVGSAPAGIPAPASTLLLSLPLSAAFNDADALAFAQAVAGDAIERIVLSLGETVDGEAGIEGVLASLQQAVDLARSRGGLGGRGPIIRRADDRPLMRLVTTLRDDHRVHEHGERMLSPLIDYDMARDGDLLDVLEAMLDRRSVV